MAMSGGAQASSFVVLEPLKDAVGPSMIVLGAPASMAERTPPEPDTAEPRVALSYPAPGGAPGPEAMRRVSPSIIALGQPIPEVSYEKLAAIEPPAPTPKKRPDFSPMVIRGGIVGDAFSGSRTMPAATTASEAAAVTGSPDNPIRKPKEPEPAMPEAAPAPQMRQPE
jgi:hypothetical protein